MKAILATRCGCQQTYTVSYPPPPEIRLPLDMAGEWSVRSFDPDMPVLPVDPVSVVESRRFILTDRVALSPRYTAHYAEVE